METKVSMFASLDSLSSPSLQSVSPASISSISSSSSSSSSSFSSSSNTGLISLMIPSPNCTPFPMDDFPPAPPNVPCVSDEELAQLSVRQLNQRLQGQDRQVVSYLKQKRRTLKNRGYALTCRVRRIQSQLKVEADNLMLRDQIRCLKQTVQSLQTRLHYYEPLASISSLTSIPSAHPSTSSSSNFSSSMSSFSSTILPKTPSELYVAQLPYSAIPFTNPYQNSTQL